MILAAERTGRRGGLLAQPQRRPAGVLVAQAEDDPTKPKSMFDAVSQSLDYGSRNPATAPFDIDPAGLLSGMGRAPAQTAAGKEPGVYYHVVPTQLAQRALAEGVRPLRERLGSDQNAAKAWARRWGRRMGRSPSEVKHLWHEDETNHVYVFDNPGQAIKWAKEEGLSAGRMTVLRVDDRDGLLELRKDPNASSQEPGSFRTRYGIPPAALSIFGRYAVPLTAAGASIAAGMGLLDDSGTASASAPRYHTGQAF